MLSPNFLIYGSEQPPAEPLRLQAGPLEMFFEPETVFLRRISLGQTEVLRGIYAAVRDRNWGTVPPRIENLRTSLHPVPGAGTVLPLPRGEGRGEGELRPQLRAALESSSPCDSFYLSFDVDCRQPGIHFRWHGQITGSSDGTVEFSFDGEAMTTFLRNRIGLCVLHPIRECAGARARYERIDGNVVELRFPQCIEPQIFGQSSFRDMRTMAHEVQPGLWAELSFEGDLFETEDQRNWTDASFKTYCTPLALPFPVEIKAGTRIHQKVTLHLLPERGFPKPHRHLTPAPALAPEYLELAAPPHPTSVLPKLGLAMASHGKPLTAEEIARLKKLNLSHLRVDLRLEDANWTDTLSRGVAQAGQLDVGLELALHLPRERGESMLEQLAGTLRQTGARIARILVFRRSEPATTGPSLQLVRKHLEQFGAPIGGGSDSHFCELNRDQALGHFGLTDADFVSWPMTPQVHALDNLSIMEALEAQPDAVVSARAFAGIKPLVVSPVTLKPRFNAVATSAEGGPDPGQLPPQVDPRQMTLFNAAWTLGSIAALASAGVESVTFFETTGWTGIMEADSGSPFSSQFPSAPGMPFPVFHVFAALAGFSHIAPLIQGGRRACLQPAALCLLNNVGHRRVVVADVTGKGKKLSLDLAGAPCHLSILSALSLRSATPVLTPQRLDLSSPSPYSTLNSSGFLELNLPPHALAVLDLASE